MRDSWRTTTLGACCDIVSGSTPSTVEPGFWDGDVEWATPKDLSELDGKHISSTSRKLTRSGLASCGATVLPPGSVLFSSRAPIGHVAINTVPMATNQGFKSFAPHNDELDPDFLFYWLRAHRRYLESLGNGATFKEVSKAVVSRVEIRLPPLPEQRSIAEMLDKTDAIRRGRKEAIALTDQLLRSTFLEMFGDPVTNPKGLRRATLGQLIEVKSGTFLPAKAMDASGSYAVYGGNGINGRHTKYMFDEPRIVIGRVGVYCGAIHRTEPKSWVTDNALYVSHASADVADVYLEHALRMAKLNQYANQAAQPLISGARINPVEVLVPPFDAQLAFGGVCETHATMMQRQSDAHDAADELFSSLVARAFVGKLDAGRTAAGGKS